MVDLSVRTLPWQHDGWQAIGHQTQHSNTQHIKARAHAVGTTAPEPGDGGPALGLPSRQVAGGDLENSLHASSMTGQLPTAVDKAGSSLWGPFLALSTHLQACAEGSVGRAIVHSGSAQRGERCCALRGWGTQGIKGNGKDLPLAVGIREDSRDVGYKF